MPVTEIIAIVSGVVGCITAVVSASPCVRLALEECYGYMKNHGEKLLKLQSLQEEVENLIRIRRRTSFELAEDDPWMINAGTILEEIRVCRDAEPGRMLNWCPCMKDYYTRYQTGKNISLITAKVNKLAKDLKGNQGSSTGDQENEYAELFRYTRSSLEGRERAEVIETIISEVLEDISSSYGYTPTFCVCGASGVGKTETVACVYNRILLQNRSRFNTYIWVEASLEDDTKKLQMKIANKIGLTDLSGDNSRDDAITLENALRQKGKILLVIDNISKAFSLDEIGFPISISHRIIITSRFSSMSRQMWCYSTFPLGILSDIDANQLLIKEAWLSVHEKLPDEILSVLKQIAQKCGGLPLVILAVAKHLRKLSGKEFDSMERDLRKELDVFSISKCIEEKVVHDLELCFQQDLKRSRYSYYAEECVLYLTMYPINTSFSRRRLIQYFLGGGLLGEVERMEENLRDAEGLLDEFLDASFLVKLTEDGWVERVKMSSLIWDITLKKAKANPRFVNEIGRIGRIRFEDWSDVERVSLMKNDLKMLPSTGEKCPKLSALFVRDNPLDSQLDDDLFNSFPNLKTLYIQNTGVSSLPRSLSGLQHLTILILRDCWGLTSLPSLAMLVELMFLDVSGSPIAELPHGFGQLTKLLHLNLSRTEVSKFPLHQLETSLYRLQELLMIGCNLLWLSRSLKQGYSAAYVEDVQQRGDMSVLEISFASLQIFHVYISSQQWLRLQSFKFCVGALYNGILRNNSIAFMKEFPDDPSWIPWTASELLLMNCSAVTQLTVPNLVYLKFLEIFNCKGLKYLFKYEVWNYLGGLQEMVIANCPNLEKIIEEDDEKSTRQANWNSLQKLTLYKLPELRFMFSGLTGGDAMEAIGIWDCHKLERFPIFLGIDYHTRKLMSPLSLKDVRGDKSFFGSLQGTQHAEEVIQEIFIEVPPPEELISRERMMGSPADMAG